MPVYKNKDNGTWYVMTQYTDWKGERKPKCKRGFATKREAQDWEQKFQQQSSGDLDMPFSAFVEIYCREQQPRLKGNRSIMCTLIEEIQLSGTDSCMQEVI